MPRWTTFTHPLSWADEPNQALDAPAPVDPTRSTLAQINALAEERRQVVYAMRFGESTHAERGRLRAIHRDLEQLWQRRQRELPRST